MTREHSQFWAGKSDGEDAGLPSVCHSSRKMFSYVASIRVCSFRLLKGSETWRYAKGVGKKLQPWGRLEERSRVEDRYYH
jgi:hypothetical protein